MTSDPFAWRPLAQQHRGDMAVVVRAPGAEADAMRGAAEITRELDPNVAVEESFALPEIVGFSLFPQRFAAGLVGLFGLLGLLAALGVYGVLSFQVAQRTRELGIRRASGARGGDLVRQVVGNGSVLALAGCGLGLLAGAAVARLIASFLVGLRTIDPVTFVGVPLVLAGVAVVASLVPAIRATSVEATEALCEE